MSDTKSSLCVRVDILAGTNILEAVTDAKSLCTSLNVGFVVFDFNEVNVNISPNADIQAVVDKFHKVVGSNTKLKIVVG